MAVIMHPMIEAFQRAREGESYTPKHQTALHHLFSFMRKNGLHGIHPGPLHIAHKTGGDSIVISQVMSWYLKAGYMEEVLEAGLPKGYRLTEAFKNFYGIRNP